jgi:acyl-CoA thioesterase II
MANSEAEDAPGALENETAKSILAVGRVAADVFRAGSGPSNHLGNVFGGRLLGQALCAAVQTVSEMPITSLHAYFLVAGTVGEPIDYRVERLRDSRRFANRQVTAHQGGRAIFSLMCQFHAPEPGLTHVFAPMPEVPAPEAVAPIQDFVRAESARLDEAVVQNFSGRLPIEVRPIAPEAYLLARPAVAERAFWFRHSSAGSLTDPREHQCMLAFASDYWLTGVSAVPHVVPTNGAHLLMSSLDHSVWFHGPARCDDWLLHVTRSPAAGDGLCLSVGQIFDRGGRLIASTSQEALLRLRDHRAHT